MKCEFEEKVEDFFLFFPSTSDLFITSRSFQSFSCSSGNRVWSCFSPQQVRIAVHIDRELPSILLDSFQTFFFPQQLSIHQPRFTSDVIRRVDHMSSRPII